MLPDSTLAEADALLAACRDKGVKLATAESCTGGQIAAALTVSAGSSDVLERAFITYSNAAKHEMVGVPMELIREHGAVSEEVAQAMAEGALRRSHAAVAAAATGLAGPGGGSPAKPVGLVCFGLARTGGPPVRQHHVFPGDRTAIRAAAVLHALRMIRTAL